MGGGVDGQDVVDFCQCRAHETQFHLPHVLDETPRHSSIRLQGMTLEDPPHESPRPATLEASHLLTGPTGCPGFEFSGLLRTIRRRARHRVSICRELIHSDQINKSEHGRDRSTAESFRCDDRASMAFRAPQGPACPAWGVGSTVRTSSTFVSAAHETRFHLPHVLDETPRHSSIRLQGMTLEDPPHESPRPPTLEASHLLTGPTGCPGFEFSGLLRTIRRRARHRVTICRELIHSDPNR